MREKNTPVRTAAYCRIPAVTDRNNKKAQERHAHLEKVIRSHKGWEMAGIYLETEADGTREEDRPQLQLLLGECREGRVSRVLVDSLGSFSRNTRDCAQLLRKFTALGVDLSFEKEQIDTAVLGAEVMCGMLEAVAENESRSRSSYIRKSIQKRFEEGTYRQPIPPYGYTWEGENLVIVPEQAEVVREIFAMVLAGRGAASIRKVLNERGIKSPTGGKWVQSALHRLIANPAYIGDAVYQQTFRDEQSRQQTNRGEYDLFYLRAHHEAIISREDFGNAQNAVRQRAKECGRNGEIIQRRGKGRYAFSGVLRCAQCGSVMYRHKLKGDDACWMCRTHVAEPDRCGMKPAGERDLQNAFLNLLNKLAWAQEPEGGNRILAPLADAEGFAQLRHFVQSWKITDDPGAFPEEAFRELVESCSVDSGRSAVFRFRGGLELEETLFRRTVE